MDARIDALLNQMTLEEKVSLAAGATFWTTVPVERVGIPAMKVTDGPNGARGASWVGDVTSACFPVGIALAATWNPELIYRIGQALAHETRSKGASVLLGPTVNIHRSPLNGRNFECYSEDPYLSARIAVAYIQGLQAEGVAACVKHFVCNDSEFERQTISSEVGERALREIYLPPFKAAAQEAGAWSLMSAYNRINGVYAAENALLLRDILKGEWGWDGLVMSDWFGTRSTVESANAGLDLEMPGPAQWMGDKLLKAVQDGQVEEAVVDDKVRRLLRLMIRTGALDATEIPVERATPSPEQSALLREAAADGLVLLKNERNVLPLDASKTERLAIIGPTAKVGLIQGGGSASVTPHYTVTPFDGVFSRAGQSLEIGYEIGCASYKMVPVLEPRLVRSASTGGEPGLKAEFFANPSFEGAPVFTRTYRTLRLMWTDAVAPGIEPHRFSARLSGVFTAQERGVYTFSLVSAGLSRLFIDDREVVDNWTEQTSGDEFFGSGSSEVTGQAELVAGQTYQLRVDFSAGKQSLMDALRIGCMPPVPADAADRAARLAAESDVALVFVGLGGEWESESYDRQTMDLPPEQNELIAKVAAANPNTVVVLNTGSPVAMPWLDSVAAVLQAWYPGQEAGNAIADVLFGAVDASGRLPQTFPKRLEDNPAFINYPGENGKVTYGEGIFVGYRYYDKKKIEPLFPFGHGLSYTTFEYSDLHIDPSTVESADGIDVRVDVGVNVTNTGARRGQDVVQLYVHDAASALMRPEKELKAFAKVRLEPGETQTVRFSLNAEALSYYDPAKRGWVAEAGTFEVLVGRSAADIRARGTFVLTQTIVQTTALGAAPRLTVRHTLKELLASDAAKAVLTRHLPEFVDHPQLGMAMSLSLEQVAAFAPDVLTPDVLKAIDTALAEA